MDICFECATLEYQIPSGILFYIGVFTLLWIWKMHKLDAFRRFNAILLFSFMSVALDLTLFPLMMYPNVQHVSSANFELFRFTVEIFTFGSSQVLKLTILNVLLFIPLGFFLKRVFRETKLFKLVVMIFCMTAFIEISQVMLSQLGFSYRIFDVDDILLNGIGGLIGIGLAGLSMQVHLGHKWLSDKSWHSYIFGIVVLIVLCYVGNHIIY